MRFLVDEDLPRSIRDLLHRYGHEAVDVRDVDLRGATDSQIAAHAQHERLCLLTGDFDFSDIRNYPPAQYPGIVVVHPDPKHATARAILALLESFLKQEALVSTIAGKLAIVQPDHIRIRR